MIDIKFRGRQIETGEWFYGDLFQDDKHGDVCIYDKIIGNFMNVTPNTIGQYTGRKDRDDVEIYDGDIVEFKNERNKIKFADEYLTYFLINAKGYGFYKLGNIYSVELRVIGNIYENPELLKG